jgi:hypothetical protein
MATKKKAAPKAVKKAEKNPTPGRASEKDFLARQREKLNKAKMVQGEFWKASSAPKSHIRVFEFTHEGERELFVEDVQHWGVEGKNSRKAVACLRKKCPICELWETDKKRFKEIKPSSNFYVNAVVRRMENGEDKQVVAQLPKSVFIRIQEAAYSDDPNILVPDCLDLNEGTDFVINYRKDAAPAQKYMSVPMPTSTKIGMEVSPVNLYDKVHTPPSQEEAQTIADACDGFY